MRFIQLVILACLIGGTAQAQSQGPHDCLPPRELRQAVASQGVVAPVAALLTARRRVPNADVLGANLCRDENVLVYIIMALQADGRIVQVRVDGPSGTVKSVH
ncbi:MAG: hypothetical protein ABW026_03085 [Microvirga sp.]